MLARPLAWQPHQQLASLLSEDAPLNPRERAVLLALTERIDTTMPTRDLIEALGNQLDAASLWEVVGGINNHLARCEDGVAFIAHHPREGFSLVCRNTSTSPADRVIGRHDFVARIGDLLAAHRLVTVLGPGGMGKTTVARRTADAFGGWFPDGVHIVDLSRLAESRLVALAAGSAMGLVLAGPDPLPGLLAFARNKKMLLVLDGCEHVTEGAARVAEAVVSAGAGMHVLATSREPLFAAGERLHRLPALDPSSAVELFVQRRRERDPNFKPDAQDKAGIDAICLRLDRLPLAIELVAARASELGLDDLSRQLEEHVLFAQRDAPPGPERHQTLAAALDWSHARLGVAEQVAFRQLSIFRGRFTLEAAEAVISGPGVEPGEVATAVVDLVDRSLLSRTSTGAFHLLDTTRFYAATKLAPEERAAVSERHARYLLKVLKRAEVDWQALEVRVWQSRYGEWVDDLRLALESCFSDGGDERLGVELVFAGFELGRQMSLDAELRRYMQSALDVLERRHSRDHLTEITLRAYLGSMGQLIAPQQSSHYGPLQQVLEQEGARIPARVQVIAVGSINHSALMSADFATAAHWADRAMVAAQDSADAVALSIAQRMSAQSLHFLGDHAEAERLALAVLAAPHRIPLNYIPSPVDPRVSMRLLLARIHWMQGKSRSAAMWADQCLEIAESDTAISRCQALAMCAIPMALWNREHGKARELALRLRKMAEHHSLGYWLYWAERVDLALAMHHAGADAHPHPMLFKSGASEANLRDHLCTFDSRLLGEDVEQRIASGLVGWCAPEVLRARAIATASAPASDPILAEQLFGQAMALAQRQGALAWQLRAAVGLVRMLVEGARIAEARLTLAAVLERFDEADESADVIEAHRLLAQLQVGRSNT